MKDNFVVTTVCNQLPCRSRFIVSSAVPEGLDTIAHHVERHFKRVHGLGSQYSNNAIANDIRLLDKRMLVLENAILDEDDMLDE